MTASPVGYRIEAKTLVQNIKLHLKTSTKNGLSSVLDKLSKKKSTSLENVSDKYLTVHSLTSKLQTLCTSAVLQQPTLMSAQEAASCH